MKTLRCYVEDRWHEADAGFQPLVNPCNEEEIARASSRGVDFAAAASHARRTGRAGLAELNIAQRGSLLLEMANVLQGQRDELIALSLENTGATRKDAKFDIDGGIFTLAHYGELGREIGERRLFLDGDGIQLGRSPRFWGQHILVPRSGVAVQINAFNFPVWGFAEKAACALLAGMPVVTKPATSTALVTERAVAALIEAGILPAGSLSLICGSTGNLLDCLGPQDVLAFTGSARTALQLRGKANLLESSTRVNIEADSLNAAVLAPDVGPADETFAVFLADVAREVTQKSGQKCTAVRRIIVPAERMAEVRDELVERLGAAVVGNPADRSITMGPLATRAQLDDAVAGVTKLRSEAKVVHGTGERIDGVANPEGKGFFFAPTLLAIEAGSPSDVVHRHEVFGPVATLLGYDGSTDSAAELVARGGGSLVTSLYTDDRDFVSGFLVRGGSTSGRLYVGSEKVAAQLPGSGLALPQVLHGGPGRAGGGEELGGMRGVGLYLQRVALTGDRGLVERVAGSRPAKVQDAGA